jgi:hypothetical protein
MSTVRGTIITPHGNIVLGLKDNVDYGGFYTHSNFSQDLEKDPI